jgi:uncharacterized protein YoxC
MESYIAPIASFVIVTIGGTIIKLFIDRAFRSIDEGLKEVSSSIKTLEKDQEELWDYANQVREDIIRLQSITSNTSKLSELKAEILEKFQTTTSAESDFNMLLSAINSLTAKFEKLEEKMFSKGRSNND